MSGIVKKLVERRIKFGMGIPCVPRVENTKKFCYSLSRKKVSCSYGNLRISQLANFKNRSFSSGQGIVQIEPNLVWSIPCVPKV